MIKFYSFTFCLTFLQVQLAFSQFISPNLLNLLNRQVPENIVETPRVYVSQPCSPPLIEAAVPKLIPAVSPVGPVSLSPAMPGPATTIITDCSPSVCKNLVNTLQLMIVCNLLHNAQGGSELAVQLAAPIINDVLSSPNFSCGCTNPLFPTPVSPNIPTVPPIFSPPPTVISPNVFSNVVSPGIPNYTNTPLANGILSVYK